MSLYIISGIIALLVLMVSYRFISYNLQQRKVQRQRLVTALKTRERNFKHMTGGYPPGFLPPELGALVYRALITTSEELVRLEPENSTHKADLVLYNAELAALKQSAPLQRVKLESLQQIKDVRQQLQELHRFIASQEASKQINQVQAAILNDQMKRLILQITVDGLTLQARQAQQLGKPRLAIHHLLQAKKSMEAENGNNQYDKFIEKISQRIETLEKQISAPPPIKHSEAEPASKEWESFAEDDNWKKKQIYD
jgi:hypothetical protein